MNVTLKDVARHANVSSKTVSRVVNNQSEIRPETRARVQSAIAELGYRPNLLAQSLVNRRSKTIAVVASGIEYFGSSRTILGIERQADELGYSLVLNLTPQAEDGNNQRILDELVARRVEGIVWAVPQISDNRHWLAQDSLEQLPPIVFLSMEPHPELAIVAVENRAGAKLGVEHLLAQGRRRVGIITGPLTWWEARERLKGWQEAHEQCGLTPDPALMVEGDWTPTGGEQAIQTLLAREPRIDALFASNDQMALGALGVMHRAGLHIPDDIAVVGFDNIPEAAFFHPPLTTIYQQVIEMGREAVKELVAHIEARRRNQVRVAQTKYLTPMLIVRASSTGTPQ